MKNLHAYEQMMLVSVYEYAWCHIEYILLNVNLHVRLVLSYAFAEQ